MPQSILDDDAVKQYLASIGEKPYRLAQIHQGVFKDYHEDIADFTTLPQELRGKIAEEFTISSLTPAQDQTATDGTNKVLFQTHDGKFIESVMMRHESPRITLCISSQVGCPVKCVFCSTGTMGFTRNLSFTEIVEQVLYFNQKLHKTGERIRNVVFMGMGEPLLNYDNVVKAIGILMNQKKFGIGVRHITISTSGIVPKIRKLMEDKVPVYLAVSLHAPNDTLRTRLMPINTAYPLDELMTVLKEYAVTMNKRIFYEYVMLREKNDSLKHAYELANLLQGQDAHVNLIPFNPGGSIESLESSSRGQIVRFQRVLQEHGLPCTVRVTLGQDIDAACGQLAVKETSTS